MGRVVYEVPLITQGSPGAWSPICWVACMAMVASERRGVSVGVGSYTGGFDPGSSSIPNPGADNDDIVRRMERCGFTCLGINATNDEIERVLQTCGPFILSHYCNGFPYGTGWGAMTSGMHAVVITGFDSAVSGGMCWMNNPWGNKDRPILASAVINALNTVQGTGFRAVGYYRQQQ